MEDKYYTPSEEDFYVGAELEVEVDEVSGKWSKLKIESLYDLEDECKYNKKYVGKYANYRIKYLDREDIESLGFLLSDNGGFKSKDNSIRLWNSDGLEIYKNKTLEETPVTSMKCLFKGIIKNKSELKKLLEQLGIK